MLDKDFLEENITNIFPDLNKTVFEFNELTKFSFTEGTLLPFLVYQNTIDKHNRIIGLYLPNNCTSINLIPFYIIIAQYRKALIRTMQQHNYLNKTYFNEEKLYLSDGTFYSLIYLDYINREVTLSPSKGRQIILPFKNVLNEKWQQNASDIRDRIESFEKIDKANNQNIFTFPINLNDNQYEGVIIFTNISKFESLLSNVRISGENLKGNINIKQVVFPSNDTIRLDNMSHGTKTNTKPISVLVAPQNAFKAHKNILDSGAEKLKHIKTIIIDNFDDLLLKWEKSDTVESELEWLRDNYIQQIINGELKNVYLICKNSNLNIHELLAKYNIKYSPWVVKPIEENELNGPTLSNPEVSINNVGIYKFEQLNYCINSIILKIKNLAALNFCNGEIIKIIKSFYELRTKLNSFYDPLILQDFFKNLEQDIVTLKNNWFAQGQDYELMNQSIGFLQDNCNNFSNFKLEIIFEYLQRLSINSSTKIIADNTCDKDIQWLVNTIQSRYPNIETHYIKRKDFNRISRDNIQISEIIFYLSADKAVIGNALGTIYSNNQMFILNNKSYIFTFNYSKKYCALQIKIGTSNFQYEILNIKELYPVDLITNQGIIPIKYNEKIIKKDDFKCIHNPVNTEIEEIEENEENDLIEEIILKHKNTSSINTDFCLIFFEDGSSLQLPSTKKVFVLDEHKKFNDLDKSLKPVATLKKGDQIVLTKGDKPLKEILEESLKHNTNFSALIETDLKWRILIKGHILRCKMDLGHFRNKLNINGFSIGSNQAVQNWIDGDTQRPEKFLTLLNVLVQLGIINSSEVAAYDYANSTLKSIQMEFVRTAIQRIILKLEGINTPEHPTFNDNLLNNLINHIEIKIIHTIFK